MAGDQHGTATLDPQQIKQVSTAVRDVIADRLEKRFTSGGNANATPRELIESLRTLDPESLFSDVSHKMQTQTAGSGSGSGSGR